MRSMAVLVLAFLGVVGGQEGGRDLRGRQLVLINPQYAFGGVQAPRQAFPLVQEPLQYGLQPQVLIYQGGAGQPFLLPGNPPGNFLIPHPQPQPGPGIVLRDGSGFGNQPQRPVFVAGFPKPAHIPKREPDAEEIPTDPKAIPPFRPQGLGAKKPEKLETFEPNDIERPFKPVPGKEHHEERDRETANKKPIPKVHPLQPGERFFILNGQPLFSNVPQFYNPYQQVTAQSGPQLRGQFDPSSTLQGPYRDSNPPFNPQNLYDEQRERAPVEDFFLRNAVTGQIANANLDDPSIGAGSLRFNDAAPSHLDEAATSGIPSSRIHSPQGQSADSQEISSLVFRGEQPQGIQSPEVQEVNAQAPATLDLRGLNQEDRVTFFRSALPYHLLNQVGGNVQSRQIEQNAQEPSDFYGNLQGPVQYLNYNGEEFDEDDAVVIDADTKTRGEIEDEKEEAEETTTPKNDEPSIAQAQPGAIALAGKGGVASAGPRGTALVGPGGLAVSSPKATAVAGPKEGESQKKKKQRR